MKWDGHDGREADVVFVMTALVYTRFTEATTTSSNPVDWNVQE